MLQYGVEYIENYDIPDFKYLYPGLFMILSMALDPGSTQTMRCIFSKHALVPISTQSVDFVSLSTSRHSPGAGPQGPVVGIGQAPQLVVQVDAL